jgi:competence protein ComFC
VVKIQVSDIIKPMNRFIKAFLDLIFPPQCAGCGKLGVPDICDDCMDHISYYPNNYCDICGMPNQVGGICEACRTIRPLFEKARSASVYDGVMKNIIHHLKFGGGKNISEKLSKLLVNMLKTCGDEYLSFDMVVPVPLSNARIKERGYNQTEELARYISLALNKPLVTDALIKKTDTKHQVDLPRHERLNNLKGAFYADPKVLGKNVLLVDDIYTTGATANETTKVLKEAGANKVFFVSLARTLHNK